MYAKRAFTLVEILIVVVILGIIAAVALPRFSNASAEARASMLMDDLRVMRCQISVFKAQHLGVPPGHPDCDPSQPATEEAFTEHMTMASTAEGETAAPGTAGFRYGPYMREVPPNPVNGKNTLEIIGADEEVPAADDSHGYIYQPSTLTFKADSVGADKHGKAFWDY